MVLHVDEVRAGQEDNSADGDLMLEFLSCLFNDVAAVRVGDDVDAFAGRYLRQRFQISREFDAGLDAAEPVCISAAPAETPASVVEGGLLAPAPKAEFYTGCQLGVVADRLACDTPHIRIGAAGGLPRIKLLGEVPRSGLQPPIAVPIMGSVDYDN